VINLIDRSVSQYVEKYLRQKEFAMTLKLTVNGKQVSVDAPPDTPLLWVIREHLGLTGTKFSCGMAQCGACTLHINGEAVRSCVFPASAAVGKSVTTIEGLSPNGTHPVQLAWKELDVPQCGYCQSGMIMSVVAFLTKKPNPTDKDIDEGVTNACRCATYHRIRKAIHLTAGATAPKRRA
jgi:isoquinoline 1-oxidoreductase alpha subunit